MTDQELDQLKEDIRILSIAALTPEVRNTQCGCQDTCGDLDVSRDDPRAVCKGLPRGSKTAPVRVVLVPRRPASLGDPNVLGG